METSHMVHNANQIALFFAAYPHEEAVAGVLDHLKKFWEKRMRQQIIDYVAQGGGGLHELVVEAVKRMSEGVPAPR
jgi:formate dehydrogenase subunit delta